MKAEQYFAGGSPSGAEDIRILNLASRSRCGGKMPSDLSDASYGGMGC